MRAIFAAVRSRDAWMTETPECVVERQRRARAFLN
jgi:hypothetical protein